MNQLAKLLLAAKLYAHRAHHITSGPTFFADHGFLADAYEAYDDAYDSIVERILGLGETIDEVSLASSAAATFKLWTSEKDLFKQLLNIEATLCDEIKKQVPSATDGTQNLLQGLADESEVRQYKIRQRIK